MIRPPAPRTFMDPRKMPSDSPASPPQEMPPADVFLDARGLNCPLPVLKARKKLLGMRGGQILEVAATDPVAVIDMPHFCAEAGHDFLGKRQEGPVTYFRISRGPVQQAREDEELNL